MKIRRDASPPAGFTLVELLLVIAIVAIVAAIAMASHRHAKMRGNETRAFAAVNAINQAQAAFAHVCGQGGFAPTLAALGTPMPTTGDPFLSPDLTAPDPVTKGGYLFVLAGSQPLEGRTACTGVTPVAGYAVTADPLIPGTFGLRFYGSNGDRVIYQDTASFAGNMPETGPPTHGSEMR
jgi:prepilin-type N-terminal cleavage/methylation domain-containing protein